MQPYPWSRIDLWSLVMLGESRTEQYMQFVETFEQEQGESDMG